MNECPRFNHLMVLPRLRIQNANAVSSPLTHGFPSITAFLGLIWALERRARKVGIDIEFNTVGVICHGHQEQVTNGRFIKSFRLTRNPVDEKGATAAIVEEGRVHLDLSLVLGIYAEHWHFKKQAADLAAIGEMLAGMRVAGGTLITQPSPLRRRDRPWIADLTDSDSIAGSFRATCVRLLPGSALVSRDDLIDRRLGEMRADNPDATRLDAWLSLARINRRHGPTGATGKGEWRHDRAGLGWVVPIPVGYGALGALHAPGSVPNARDTQTPFRFVESLFSVGEWVGAHRLRTPRDLLWYADSRPDEGLYRCRNDYRADAPIDSAYPAS